MGLIRRRLHPRFTRGIAGGLVTAATSLCGTLGLDTVVLSGGVFQNRLLMRQVRRSLHAAGLCVWTNRSVPANDGGLSLGQAAIACARQDRV